MYIFLIERAHALRAAYVRRTHDWIWVLGIAAISIGFGTIAIVAFVYPSASISTMDGECRIGLPSKVTIPLLAYDITINVALTALFIYLLVPSLRFEFRGPRPRQWACRSFRCTVRRQEWSQSHEEGLDNNLFSRRYQSQETRRTMRWLAWKSVIGAVLVLLPTVGNLGFLYYVRGTELGWLCITLCTLDSTSPIRLVTS